jgi:hypothetical protein
MPDTTAAGVRRALLVGINAYKDKPLDGCIADAELMAQVLRDTFAFDEKNVTVLRDRAASREKLLAEFDQLIDVTNAGDTAFVFYAGHGATADSDDHTEASGKDSTLNLCEDPREDVYDDELKARLDALAEKTQFTVLVVDACNSGTITRDVADPTRKVRSGTPVKKSARPPKNLGPHAATPTTAATAAYTLIAASRDDEEAEESAVAGDDNNHHGALTWALAQELTAAKGGETWRDVFQRVARRVTTAHPTQHPQLEGNADRELFGLRTIPTVAYVQVTDRASASVVIGAGALHGVTVGTTYTVYADDTKAPTDTTPALGTLEVTIVKGTTSRARIVTESQDGAIAPGTRAFAAALGSVEQMLATVNTDPKTKLTGAVTLELWKLVGETWEVAAIDPVAKMPIYESGERIGFSITSTVDTPLFVNLFDVDAHNAVTAFTKGDANRLVGKGTFEIGKADGRKIAMMQDGPDAIERFKLFASVSEVHLQYLTQLDPRGRAPEELKVISADDWTAVTREILLRQAPTTGR